MGIPQPPVPMLQLALVLSCTLLACKLGKSEDDPESRPLPAVDGSAPAPQPATPPPAPQPAAPVPVAPAPAAPAPAAPAPADPAQVAAATTGAKPTATTGAKPGTTNTSAAATTGAASTTGAATTGGSVTVPSAACINKCGNAMRKCLADAKFGDDVATKCQGAFASCQKDCAP